MRGATLDEVALMPRSFVISIHAPRAGCDVVFTGKAALGLYFNPRTPCGVRRLVPAKPPSAGVISIHAPRAGCDDTFSSVSFNFSTFQSTHPVRGATDAAGIWKNPQQISIHAPRAGCDPAGHRPFLTWRNFNPRTPCGVRLSQPLP